MKTKLIELTDFLKNLINDLIARIFLASLWIMGIIIIFIPMYYCRTSSLNDSRIILTIYIILFFILTIVFSWLKNTEYPKNRINLLMYLQQEEQKNLEFYKTKFAYSFYSCLLIFMLLSCSYKNNMMFQDIVDITIKSVLSRLSPEMSAILVD